MPLFPFFSRPASKTPWASSGNVDAPSDGERAAGYADGARPGSRRFNFLLNELASGMRYFLQRGVPDWVNDDSFPQYAMVRDPFDGQIYYAYGAPTDGTAPHSDAAHWKTISPAAGATLATREITASGSYAVTPGTKLAIIEAWAGGGAGGGIPALTAGGGRVAVGGGGSAGGHGRRIATSIPGANWVVVIGAAGTATAGADGGAGGDTTVTDGAATLTVHGGPGGKLGALGASGSFADGGAAPAAATNVGPGGADYSGEQGEPGFFSYPGSGTQQGLSGRGGSATVGGGGRGRLWSTAGGDAGRDATGFASGGGGAIGIEDIFSSYSSTAGGAATPGCVRLIEFA